MAGASQTTAASEVELLDWNAALTGLQGIGPVVAATLQEAGLASLGDLLGLFPRRHRAIADVERPDDALVGQLVRLRGRQRRATLRWLPGRRCLVEIEFAGPVPGGDFRAPFFNQRWMKDAFADGAERQLEGRLDKVRGRFVLTAARVVSKRMDAAGDCVVSYPTLEGVSDLRLRSFVHQALRRVDPASVPLVDVPALTAAVGGLELPRGDRLAPWRAMHEPRHVAEHEAARRHFALAEAVGLFRRVEARRRERSARPAPSIEVGAAHAARMARVLPFAWTDDQAAAVAAIRARLRGADGPSAVLLHGDVGTGKTAVVLDAALAAIDAGYQVALLAPTGLLAEQHAAGLGAWLAGEGVRTAMLRGDLPAAERRELEDRLAASDIDLVFGTHALFSARTRFAALGLVVVDEQHRFGVAQRAAMARKGRDPHVLVTTATPIPRTLTYALFGDLDLVELRTRPHGNPPPRAVEVARERWSKVLRAIEARCRRGEGVFVVCPKIGEDGGRGGAVRMLRELSERFSCGLVHGRLSAEERQTITQAFRDGAFDVLVGTTVLEVGIDVPRATLMVVAGAEHFGIATLHQLRGRVGRGAKRGLCILAGESSARTRAVATTTCGFALAEEDLRLRGAGELLGARQSGALDFRALDPLEDAELLAEARELVRGEATRHPRRSEP